MKIKQPFLQYPGPVLSILLSPLQFPFLAVTVTRYALYITGALKPHTAKCSVISIGNLTLGGTGKTPLTQYTAKLLAKNNYHTTIISRGYGKLPAYATLTDDEAFDKIPTVTRLVGNNKSFLTDVAVKKFNPKFIILDDGFQSLYIKRDLNILVIDCLNPFGSGKLFPAGILREPLYAMRRAGLVVLSHADFIPKEQLESLKSVITRYTRAPIACTSHKPECFVKPDNNSTLPLEFLAKKSVVAFCGIGNPNSFRKTLESMNVKLAGFYPYPDHYKYGEDDMRFIADTAKQLKADAVCMTTKDLSKVHGPVISSGIPAVALKISMEFTENKDVFHKMVLGT